jgi:hypothetical protein
MSVQVNGDDIMLALHVARIVGSIVMMLFVALLIAWAVRTPRRTRDRHAPDEAEAGDNEDLWRVVDRMEERLEVLERVLADQVEQPPLRAPRRDGILAPAEEGRDSGRIS